MRVNHDVLNKFGLTSETAKPATQRRRVCFSVTADSLSASCLSEPLAFAVRPLGDHSGPADNNPIADRVILRRRRANDGE
ncbi:hypothetical protein MNBD_GAMMA09-1163 [hydrothermal vent metagenome]|uniref:Uncharacterized protein n=1 Tax=hydrothermal vent metagenome TaxID=652676 RepID=A0A3B0XI75_9ZZZZ